MFDAVHWRTWNPTNGRATTYPTHAVDVDAPQRTACGMIVPDMPVEVTRGESVAGWCGKCKAALEDSLGFAIG